MPGYPGPVTQGSSFSAQVELLDHHACKFCAIGLGSPLNSREFLNYHDERERSWRSLIVSVYDDRGVQVGCMPVSVGEGPAVVRVESHVGTVFAGLRVASDDVSLIRNAYQAVIKLVRDHLGGDELVIRLPPELVVSETAAHLWSLWSLGFQPDVVYLGRALRLPNEVEASRLRRRGMARAIQCGGEVHETRQVSRHAHQVLRENRMRRHGVAPLHSLDDLDAISRRVPGLVRLFQADHDDHLCAGAIVFVHAKYATLQYLFRSECPESSAMQDLALYKAIEALATQTPWLLLGTSTEPNDNHRAVNAGLDFYKQSWRSIPYTAHRMKRRLGDTEPSSSAARWE